MKNIRVGKSQSFIIIRIQFLIQFAIARSIHFFQGLPLNELVVDPTHVKKQGLTHTSLSHIEPK
jgi:hypothetical protein